MVGLFQELTGSRSLQPLLVPCTQPHCGVGHGEVNGRGPSVRNAQEIEAGEPGDLIQVPLLDAALGIGLRASGPTAALGEAGMGFFKEKAWGL